MMPISLLQILLFVAAPQDSAGPVPREIKLTGRVLTLERVLRDAGVAADADTLKQQVVLKQDDGTVVPLLSNVASRALFLDERLRDRPTKIDALQRPGLPYCEVVLFQVEEDGKMRTPEYWCDVCAISVRYPQICPCCQGDMRLRYKGVEER
jgi:hypothetical protein